MSLFSCDCLSIAYAGKKVLSDVSFSVNSGEYWGIIGENGAGKSTLIKGLLKLEKLSGGKVILGEGLQADEIGYLPLQPGDANLLFQIIDRRYEKKSTIVTSNINFDEWATILHDERVANAIVDRLLHHAHVISITGDSYRLRNHMQQKE